MSNDLDDLDPAPGAMAPLDRQAPPDYREASRADIMPRLDAPPAASSPAVLVPVPGGTEAEEPAAAPAAELVAAIDSGPTGVADPFSEDSATPVDPSDAMTGAVSAFVRSAVRAEPSPEDATTDPWANLARARTSAFIGAPALALALPRDDAGSRTAAHEAEHHGRRRGVWAAIAGGMVAAAAVVVYIAMGHGAPGARSQAAMSAESGGHAIEQTATTAVPQATSPRPAAPRAELTASSVGTGGQHAVASAGPSRLGPASNTETTPAGAAASAGAGGAASASAGSDGERSIVGAAAGWRSGDAAQPAGARGAEGKPHADGDGGLGGLDPAAGAKPAPPAAPLDDAEAVGTPGDGVAATAPAKSMRAAKDAPATSEVGDAIDGNGSEGRGAVGDKTPGAGGAAGGNGPSARAGVGGKGPDSNGAAGSKGSSPGDAVGGKGLGAGGAGGGNAQRARAAVGGNEQDSNGAAGSKGSRAGGAGGGNGPSARVADEGGKASTAGDGGGGKPTSAGDAGGGKAPSAGDAGGGKAPSAGDGGGGKGTGAGGAQEAGDRARLSDEDIARGMQPVSGKLRACFAGAHGAAVLRFAVAPSGRVVTAVVVGALAGTSGAGCATSAVRTAAFAPWSGAPQIVEYRVPLD